MSRLGQVGGMLYRGEVSVNFVGKRRMWYTISAVIIVISLAALIIRGLDFSVEFTGGAVFTVEAPSASISQVQKAVTDGGVSGAVVQQVGSGSTKKWQVQTSTLTNNQTRKLWIRSLKRDMDILGLRLPGDPWQGDRARYPEEAADPLAVYLDVDEVPSDVKPWLNKLLRSWVQSKYARQNDPIVFAAPTPEAKVETGHQLRDERAYGLQVARMLRGLGEDPDPIAEEAERSLEGGTHKLEFLKQPLSYDWADCIANGLLAARANAAASLACFGSCLVPFGAWAAQHYQFQTATAEQWLARAKQLESKTESQAALKRWYPYALDAFGADGSANEERYCVLGIKTAQNAQVRQIFVDQVGADLKALGLNGLEPYRGVRARYSGFLRVT